MFRLKIAAINLVLSIAFLIFASAHDVRAQSLSDSEVRILFQQFKSLPFEQRVEVQNRLKLHTDWYTDHLDGLWGHNTSDALSKYYHQGSRKNSKNTDDNLVGPDQIINYILSDNFISGNSSTHAECASCRPDQNSKTVTNLSMSTLLGIKKAPALNGPSTYNVKVKEDTPILQVFSEQRYCGAIFKDSNLDIVSYQSGQFFVRVFDQNIPFENGRYDASAILSPTADILKIDFDEREDRVTVIYEDGELIVVENLQSKSGGYGTILTTDALNTFGESSLGRRGTNLFLAVKIENEVVTILLPLDRKPHAFRGKSILDELTMCQGTGVNLNMLPNFEKVNRY